LLSICFCPGVGENYVELFSHLQANGFFQSEWKLVAHSSIVSEFPGVLMKTGLCIVGRGSHVLAIVTVAGVVATQGLKDSLYLRKVLPRFMTICVLPFEQWSKRLSLGTSIMGF